MTNPRHVTADLAISYIHWTAGITLTQDQLRQWASRGHITRTGHTPQGRNIYDLTTIVQHLKRRGLA